MAEVAVELLLGRLGSLIIEQGKLLGGVGRDVNDLKDDLETMRSFLQAVDARGETDQLVKNWVKQVRAVAYDTEDVLDEFLLRLVRPRKQGILDYLLHKLHYITQLKARCRLATEMHNIKARLKTISERRSAFSLTDISEGITRATTPPNTWHDPRIASRYIDEAEVVGIEVPKNILIEWLTEGESKLTIISVVGMGGLGKTTLVKKVYDSQMVKTHFDCHVWITVSKSPEIGELLRKTIKGVLNETKEQAPQGMDAMDNDELIEELNKKLGEKRYVIIFDDIWDTYVWEAMKFAFPDPPNCGSRIIFTTRTADIAPHRNYIHNLKPLEEQEAWRLFCMKAFESNHDSGSGCPKELEELSRNILKKCSGLPLAIVLIGGLLWRKGKTVLEWQNIHDSLGAEMRNNNDLDSLGRILMLSYNNLPYYLKPCFLYLSMFPEDYSIRRMMLIRLWIAEGFVEEKKGVTMEDVAGNYVNELISRSMIQVVELNSRNEVKSCRIHDLMRETILLKCKEECFSTTINIGSQEEEGGMGVELHEKPPRRISIYHNNTTGGDENYSYPMGSRCSHIRSLMMFKLDESPARSFGDKFFLALRLLRVLDLEGADLVEFPPGLAELIHLRYLSLRSTKITVLPKSVGKLKNLETLNLKQTNICELPVEILKLQRLRHLLVYRDDNDLGTLTFYRHGVRVPIGIGNLTSLQRVGSFDVQHRAACDDDCVVLKELGKLTQLRRLGITNLRTRDGSDLCLALEKMEHLHILEIARSKDVINEEEEEEEEFLELESLMSPPRLLRSLFLDGRLMRLPVWIARLRNLTYLGLCSSRLSSCAEENDPLKAFQHMPNLGRLALLQAYDGEELCCSEVGGYKNLKKLFLMKMEGLKRVRFMQGSMPMLKELNIFNCPALEMVPLGIEHLSGLQELRLVELNLGLVDRIRKRRPRSPPPMFRKRYFAHVGAVIKKRIRKRPILLPPPQEEAQGEGGGEDCWRVQHIPKIYHVFRNTEGTLVADNLLFDQYV